MSEGNLALLILATVASILLITLLVPNDSSSVTYEPEFDIPCTSRFKGLLSQLRNPWDTNTVYWESRMESRIQSFDRYCRADAMDKAAAMGCFYGELGNWSTALSYFKKALRLEPRNPTLMYFCAFACLRMHDYRQALSYGIQSAQYGYAPGTIISVQVALELEMYDNAIKYIDALCVLSPDDPKYVDLYTDTAVALLAENHSLRQEIERLETEIVRLRFEIERLEAQVRALESEIVSLKAQLRSAQQRHATITEGDWSPSISLGEVVLGAAGLLIPYWPIQLLCTALGILW